MGVKHCLWGASSSHPLLFELILVLLAESFPASLLLPRHSNHKDENGNIQFHSKPFQVVRAHFSLRYSFSEHLSSRETVFKAICAQTVGFTSCAEGLSLPAECSLCLGQLVMGTHNVCCRGGSCEAPRSGSDSCPAHSERRDVSSKSTTTRGS